MVDIGTGVGLVGVGVGVNYVDMGMGGVDECEVATCICCVDTWVCEASLKTGTLNHSSRASFIVVDRLLLLLYLVGSNGN